MSPCATSMRRRSTYSRGETPNVDLNARQKWLALRFNSRASSRIEILSDRWASTYAQTLRACHAGRPPRGILAAGFEKAGKPLAPRFGWPRSSATACAMCALVASRSPARARHAAFTSWTATSDSPCANASWVGVPRLSLPRFFMSSQSTSAIVLITRHPDPDVLWAVSKLDTFFCASAQETHCVSIYENKILEIQGDGRKRLHREQCG